MGVKRTARRHARRRPASADRVTAERECAPDEHARRTQLRAIDEKTFKRAALVLMAVSYPSRLRLLIQLLGGHATIGVLAKATATELSLVSKHLRVLRLAGLVVTSREGRQVSCRLADKNAERLARLALAYAEAVPGRARR